MRTRCGRVFGMIMALMLCAAVLFGIAPSEAHAYSGIGVDDPCSLSLGYRPDHGSREGLRFRLYRVGNVDEAARLSIADDWKDYPISMTDLDVAGWASLANTLSGYVDYDDGKTLKPAYTGKTDKDGNLKFSDVHSGVYLLLGDPHNVEEKLSDGTVVTYHYEPRPEMIVLPYLKDDNWIRDLEIGAVKYEVTDTREHPTVDRRVIKVWNDDGNRTVRPSSIEVALLRDNVVHEVVTLDALNAWRHTWTDLDAKYSWRIVELTRPLNYRVTQSQSGTTFILTNTYVEPDTPVTPWVPPVPPTTPPDVPEPPVTPTPPSITVVTPDPPDDIPDPSVPLTPWLITTPTPTPTPTEDLDDPDVPLEDLGEPDVPLEDLPQTGQLWWPVPLLAGAAVLLFVSGAAMLRRKDK